MKNLHKSKIVIAFSGHPSSARRTICIEYWGSKSSFFKYLASANLKNSELSNNYSGNGTAGYAWLFLQAFKQTQLWKKTKQNSLGKKSPFLKKPGSLAPKTKFLFVQTQCTAGCRPSAACKRCTNKKPELCTLREEKRGEKGQRSGPLWPIVTQCTYLAQK